MQAVVRILWPADGYVEFPDGQMLCPDAPWPVEILSPEGELPEYVIAANVDGKMKWVDAREIEKTGPRTRNRAT